MRNDAPPQTCGHCRRFSPCKDEKLQAHGFGSCTHLPHWRSPSPGAACAFNPSRFEAREAA